MNNQNIKACLFDLDGVLVFTDKYHYLAWKSVADENGWDFNETVNNRCRGIPRLASLNEILKHNHTDISEEDKVRVMRLKNDRYVELLSNMNESDTYPGSFDFIRKLRERGVKIALCSSSKNADMVIDKLNVRELFDVVVTGNDIKNAKPDPGIFITAAQRLGINPFHCVVFEDSLAGIEGAAAGGMKTMGVGNRAEVADIAMEYIDSYDEIDIDNFIESGLCMRAELRDYTVTENCYRKPEAHHFESMFALVNGYMGIRGALDEETEWENPGVFCGGVFGKEPINHVVSFKGYAKNDEFTVKLNDWRIVNLFIDGEKVGFEHGKMLTHSRTLDMLAGKLIRRFVWESKAGKQVSVVSERMLNMEQEHTGELRYTVTPLNFDGKVKIESKVIKVLPVRGRTLTKDAGTRTVGETRLFHLKTIPNEIETVCAYREQFLVKPEFVSKIEAENEYCCEAEFSVKENIPVTLEKYVAFYSSRDGVENMDDLAEKEVADIMEKGFDRLSEIQTAFWKAFWEQGDVKIDGNDRDQTAVRFNLYQLRQQLPKANHTSIGATGLTGEHYSGQIFWDTEMYISPYLNYLDPAQTKPLLRYRYEILDKARERAQLMDGKGAMYSWSSIDGEETSVVFEASTAEYHLQSDIAYALWRYYSSTGDTGFMNQYGNEVLFETARYMFSRGVFVEAADGKFCINAVCGPDEYGCGVNNNFYTNFLCKFHFEFAARMYEKMKNESPEAFRILMDKIHITEDEVASWKMAAERMYYRYNEKLGIYEQDDHFVYNDPVDMSKIPMNKDIRGDLHPLNLWRAQVIKQADVLLLMFVRGELFTKEEKVKNYEYYEPKTNHGSSLSAGVHTIIANEIGKYEDAYAYFRSCAYMDISDFKHNTGGGLHLACLGSVWMAVVNGFLGMRDYERGLEFNPRIPEQWNAIETKICYRGSVIHIRVDKKVVSYTLLSGNPVKFVSASDKVELFKSGDKVTLTISK